MNITEEQLEQAIKMATDYVICDVLESVRKEIVDKNMQPYEVNTWLKSCINNVKNGKKA